MDANALRLGAVVAGVVTVACGVFAVAMAATSDDEGGGGAAPAATGPPADGTPVAIATFAFDPAEVSVAVGTSVTWTNQDPDTHNIRTEDGSIESPDLGDGDAFTATFDEAGTVSYFCGIHDFMQGTVTVTP